MGGSHAFVRMKLALFALQADAAHRSRGHGGAIDADRKACVLGKVTAHPRCRSGLSEDIDEALDMTMELLIQALDGPAARSVVALASRERCPDPCTLGAG